MSLQWPERNKYQPGDGAGLLSTLGSYRGMTLVEMMVVLAIIVAITGMGFWSMGLMARSKLRDETLRFSGAVTYVYHQAALRNIVYRLVIDMDENEYWSEVAEGNVKLPSPDDDGFVNPFEDDDLSDEEMFKLHRPPVFESSEDTLLKKRKLEEPLRFAGVITEHNQEMIVEGKVTITFFPSGYAERAFLYLSDGQGYYSISIDSLTGKVHTYSSRKEIPSDFFELEELD